MNRSRSRRLIQSLLLSAALLAPGACARAGEAQAAATPSGQPVPRFVSLKSDVANGREGPSRNHRILWVYQRRGLPLKVVQEWEGWRKVEDPFGDQTWLLSNMLEKRRTIYVLGEDGGDVLLRARPDLESKVRASVERGVIGELRTCSRGWCEVRIGETEGWAPRRVLWGTDGVAPEG
jgi:SH3-like domain-containing protein